MWDRQWGPGRRWETWEGASMAWVGGWGQCGGDKVMRASRMKLLEQMTTNLAA